MAVYPLSYARRYLGRRPAFRVNYGNGQVSQTFRDAREAQRNLLDGWCFIEWQDAQTGDWFRLKTEER